jgi:hypothetical protein
MGHRGGTDRYAPWHITVTIYDEINFSKTIHVPMPWLKNDM